MRNKWKIKLTENEKITPNSRSHRISPLTFSVHKILRVESVLRLWAAGIGTSAFSLGTQEAESGEFM